VRDRARRRGQHVPAAWQIATLDQTRGLIARDKNCSFPLL
jgi:hypothetical protein